MKIAISIAVVAALYSIVSIVGSPVSPPGPPEDYSHITPCSAVSCAPDHICVDVPEDLSCARGINIREGRCRLIPNCIPRQLFQQRPNNNPVYQRGQCARMNCGRDTYCIEVSDPYCFRYPCAEVARCVPGSYLRTNNNNNNNNNNRNGNNYNRRG